MRNFTVCIKDILKNEIKNCKELLGEPVDLINLETKQDIIKQIDIAIEYLKRVSSIIHEEGLDVDNQFTRECAKIELYTEVYELTKNYQMPNYILLKESADIVVKNANNIFAIFSFKQDFLTQLKEII